MRPLQSSWGVVAPLARARTPCARSCAVTVRSYVIVARACTPCAHLCARSRSFVCSHGTCWVFARSLASRSYVPVWIFDERSRSFISSPRARFRTQHVPTCADRTQVTSRSSPQRLLPRLLLPSALRSAIMASPGRREAVRRLARDKAVSLYRAELNKINGRADHLSGRLSAGQKRRNALVAEHYKL